MPESIEPELSRTAYEVFRLNTMCAEAPLEIEQGTDDALLLEQVELEVP